MKITIRTCICCRVKKEQNLLYRLQCIEKKLVSFTGFGRSFYICASCIESAKNLEKALYRQCKNKDDYIVQLKEILANGR
ncbi:MAG: hypothetical protein U9Q04_02435 [Campylobacterota bacterium]|nr:hypothetical protein [Campylobacterota bacterium]